MEEAVRAELPAAVLVVGHSETVPDLVKALGGPQVEVNTFDNLFIIIRANDAALFIRGRYGRLGIKSGHCRIALDGWGPYVLNTGLFIVDERHRGNAKSRPDGDRGAFDIRETSTAFRRSGLSQRVTTNALRACPPSVATTVTFRP